MATFKVTLEAYKQAKEEILKNVINGKIHQNKVHAITKSLSLKLEEIGHIQVEIVDGIAKTRAKRMAIAYVYPLVRKLTKNGKA